MLRELIQLFGDGAETLEDTVAVPPFDRPLTGVAVEARVERVDLDPPRERPRTDGTVQRDALWPESVGTS